MAVDSCIGSEVDTFWGNLCAGVSGIRPITAPDADRLPIPIGGEVAFDPAKELPREIVRRSVRSQQLLLRNVGRLLDGDARRADPAATALVVGTGGAALPSVGDVLADYARGGWRAIERMGLLKCLPNTGAALAAQQLSIRGPVLTIVTACASSTDAIAEAYRIVRDGRAEVAIGAGVEAWITELSLGGFWKLRALSRRGPEEAAEASRPFDLHRDGIVPAEGAASLLLEDLERAEEAGRPILAEVLGAGATCDAHHPVQPDPDGAVAAAAIAAALRDAGIAADEVDHVNVHGTSTRLNDKVETRVLRRALGERAGQIPMTAPKGAIGHAMGACGAIESVAAVCSLLHQYVPPTVNLHDPDPECDLDFTPLRGRSHAMEIALKTSFGFGGHNAALVFRRFTGRRG